MTVDERIEKDDLWVVLGSVSVVGEEGSVRDSGELNFFIYYRDQHYIFEHRRKTETEHQKCSECAIIKFNGGLKQKFPTRQMADATEGEFPSNGKNTFLHCSCHME